MSTSKVLYSGPYFDGTEIEAAIACLKEGAWYPAGKEVDKFERQFSKVFGFGSSLMVNSGSSANLVMLAALKKYFEWPDGAEIIVCVVGFPTTINPILQNNLVPKFVDITWDDLNWNLDHVEAAITDKTVAVFSSPVLGNCYDLDRLLDICSKHSLKYIADNCDSLGSKWDGDYLTKEAVAASTSFYPAHHITTLEGGMVSSNIPEIIQLARQFAWWGRDCYCVGACNTLAKGMCGKRFDYWLEDYDALVDHKYVFSQIGYNLKPLDLQGAIGQVQLKKFDEVHRIRRSNYKQISSHIEDRFYTTDLRIIKEKPQAETSWFGVPIVCDNAQLKTALQQHLETNGVQTRNYFAGNLLLHPAYKHLGNAKDFPNAYDVLKRVFFLGTAPCITREDLVYIKKQINSFALKTPIGADGHSVRFLVN
jgi:CDP-6-deoxy-D-xylo-4-hexulose-3-dehydrase